MLDLVTTVLNDFILVNQYSVSILLIQSFPSDIECNLPSRTVSSSNIVISARSIMFVYRHVNKQNKLFEHCLDNNMLIVACPVDYL